MCWHELHSKGEAKAVAEDFFCDFIDIEAYDNPGWYYIYTDRKRCPRGCCYDTFARIIKPETRANELVEKIRQLTFQLVEARKKS
jgi:hypothetical protein